MLTLIAEMDLLLHSNSHTLLSRRDNTATVTLFIRLAVPGSVLVVGIDNTMKFHEEQSYVFFFGCFFLKVFYYWSVYRFF